MIKKLPKASFISSNNLVSAANSICFGSAPNCKHQSSVANSASVKPFNEIPGPKTFPIFGSLFSIKPLGGELNIVSMEELSNQLQKKYGDLVRLCIMDTIQVFTFNPDHIKKVFQTDGETPSRISLEVMIKYCQIKGYPITLAHSQGERWRILRTASNYVARPQSINFFIPKYDQITNEFIEYLNRQFKNGSKTLLYDNLDAKIKMLTLELISTVTIDNRIICVDESKKNDMTEFVKAVDVIFTITANLLFGLPLWKYYPTRDWKQFVSNLDILFEVTEKYIKEAYEHLTTLSEEEKNNLNSKTILQQYLLTKDKYNLTYKDIVALISDFILAGIDTTSSAIHFAIYEVSRNQEIQDSLYEEIKQIIGDSEHVTEEHLSKMQMLKAILKETLRLHSVATILSRYIKEDLIIDNYHIPKDTNIMMGISNIGRSEKYFKNSNVFNPRRWCKSDKENEACMTPYSYLPFGFGVRQCIGRRIAEQEIYMTLIKLFQNFQVEYVGEPLGHCVRLATSPNKPLNVKLTKRK